MLFMNKPEFSSLFDCFVGISETIEEEWFCAGFPPFDAFLMQFFNGENMYLFINKV
jgi:hypothetical protein